MMSMSAENGAVEEVTPAAQDAPPEAVTPPAADPAEGVAPAEPVAEVEAAIQAETAEMIEPVAEVTAAVVAEAAEVAADTETAEAAEPMAEGASAARPQSLADLKPKMGLTGTVKHIELFGAFVDIGVGRDGLVHISQISDQPVKNVNDVVTVGQDVKVWVRRVDIEQGRIDLTMIEPPGLTWNEIQTGQVLTGTVVRVERFGAFVELGAERPGMVHVSELSSGYVGAPEEVVKVGDEVQVKVIKVNSRKKQIDLSIKALEMPAVEAAQQPEEEEGKIPTTIELALRRAMQATEESFPALEKVMASADADRSSRKQNKRERREKRQVGKHRQQQEEIMSRTLGNREPGRDRGAGAN